MKLIVILIIIMSIIFLIGFIIIFFLKLRKKKIKSSRKIKYRLCDPNSYHSSIIKNRKFKFKSNNDLVNNKKVLEMLTYLQERDIANYNNIIPTFYSILEKPIQHNLEANKNVNYLLTNIVDILCHHHHSMVNPLHLIKHLFNKCNNKLHQHKKILILLKRIIIQLNQHMFLIKHKLMLLHQKLMFLQQKNIINILSHKFINIPLLVISPNLTKTEYLIKFIIKMY